MNKQRVFLLLLVSWLVACTADLEPIEVTRVTETAVSTHTHTPTPTSLPLPTLTATPPAPTTPATATVAPVTTTPTATATVTAVPTATPAIPLSEFLTTLQDNLNARDLEALKSMMTKRFMLNVYPFSKSNSSPTYMEGYLVTLIGGETPEIVISEENILAQVTEPFTPETLFGDEQMITAVVLSSGWASVGTMQVMLYITVENGVYAWAGLVASPDNFALLPELPLMAPPPGLIYRRGNEWWRINAVGEAESMQMHSGELSLNPSGTLALYAEIGAQQLMLVHFPEGNSETIDIEGTLVHSSGDMPWLDEDTAVLIIVPPEKDPNEGLIGNLSLLHVLEGTIVALPPLLDFYAHPSVTTDGGILYYQDDELYLWRDDNEQILNYAHTVAVADELRPLPYVAAPVMSPDGHYVTGVSSLEYGRFTIAYVLADLTNQTTTFLSPFVHLATDAAVPYGIHWSPDSQWVALDPPVWIWDNNVPVIPVANPENRFLLGAGTSHPIWLDNNQLLFRSVNYEQIRWRYLNIATGEQFWLDLPDGAEVVHYVPHS